MAFNVPTLPTVAHLNPWLSIWVRPRATLRYILQTDPTTFVFALCFFGSMVEALDRASGRSLGDHIPFPFVLLLCVLSGGVGAVLTLAVGARLLCWAGHSLGGEGTLTDVKAALGWSNVPNLVVLLLWLPLLALIGPEMFTTSTPRLDANPVLALLPLVTGLLQIMVAMWAFVIYLKCLAEAHRFSAWRALGASIFAFFIVVAILIGLMIPIFVLMLIGR
jgi:hypothetical protein